MKTVYQGSVKNNQSQKHEELAQTFLLYNFFKLSKTKKEKYFDKQVPEIILRTMKLEGEEVTAGDIKKILKSTTPNPSLLRRGKSTDHK